jgi:hypothetical protein
MPKYLISWWKFYSQTGEVKIEASTEEEAIQIAKENISEYEGHWEWEYDQNEIESWGVVEND